MLGMHVTYKQGLKFPAVIVCRTPGVCLSPVLSDNRMPFAASFNLFHPHV